MGKGHSLIKIDREAKGLREKKEGLFFFVIIIPVPQVVYLGNAIAWASLFCTDVERRERFRGEGGAIKPAEVEKL